MSDGGRSPSHASTEELNTTVVIRAPPASLPLLDDGAVGQRPPSAQGKATKCSLPSPSSLAPPAPGEEDLSQQRSRHRSITRVLANSARKSGQLNAAAAFTNETVAESVSSVTNAAEVQMVADLSELYHAPHSLLQARQHARTSDETCAELRRRCQDLETEKLTLRLELQEMLERLHVRQAQTEELRRDATGAKLAVLSLTAERDQLSSNVQEAWDRVAELSDALRRQEIEMRSLQTDITAARHSEERALQQHSHVEQQLRVVQEQLRVRHADELARGTAQQRLSAALQSALERVAGLLGNVIYDYQQSLAYDSLSREEGTASGVLACIAEHAEAGLTKAASTKSDAGGIPHVVLFSADSHSASAPAANALMETPLRQGGSAAENARAHAEDALHCAEAAVFGKVWGTEGLSPPLVSASRDEASEAQTSAGADLAAATRPERHHPSRPSSHQALMQNHRPSISQDATGGAEAAPQISAATTLTDEASLRTALTPLLLALKHVATVLSSVRHQRRRWAADAAHFKQCYEEAQRQLEAARHMSASQESMVEVSRGRIGALQRRVEEADAALLECRREEAHRRGRLAQTLKCSEDWGLIQHSVELLQVRLRELSKDLRQLQEQRLAASAVDAERMKQTACDAAAEVRYQELHQQYCALKDLKSTWPAASRGLPPLQSSEALERMRAPLAPSTVQSFSSSPTPPPLSLPLEHKAVSVLLGSPTVVANAAAPVAEQSRSSSVWRHPSRMTPAMASTSRGLSEEGTENPDVPPTHKEGDVRGGVSGTPLRESASASPAEANSKPSTLVQWRAGQTPSPSASVPASPSLFITATEVEGPVHAYTRVAEPPLSVDAPAINGISCLPKGPSSTAARPHTSVRAPDAERMLPASPYRDPCRSLSSASASYAAPSPPCTTTPCANSGVIISPYARRPYRGKDMSRGAIDGAADYSSIFATEVLHVIEALDRRVSGALNRTQHA
ncbi:hypothetical protein LSCM1_05156 [Leishmania martiniquensis]|uniref:Uncharacterized protein n=1 Tax=Leishmania martiniquensis TaxID=1580590 RepID=A0A836GPY5_9TRYP|nr:hypothetical protein LSCM1_05156 [Leishmania martiniquensis]